MKKILKQKESLIFMILLVLIGILSVISNSFLTLENFGDLLKGNSVIGIMALGMLPILISGGIDLSISGTITLSAVITGELLVGTELNLVTIIFLSTFAGMLIGVINGLVITKVEIPAIIATLGTLSITMGAVLYYTKGNMITNLPLWFREFGVYGINLFGLKIPVQFLFFLGAAILTHLLLKYTVVGRGIYSIGGNREASLRIGYNVDGLEILIYAYSGAMAGLAAVMNASIVQGVNPNTFEGIELIVISTVVIGGASTLGGVGTVLGTTLGIALMAVLNNGLVLAKIPTFWQQIVMGIIIILAIGSDVLNVKREQAKLIKVDVEE